MILSSDLWPIPDLFWTSLDIVLRALYIDPMTTDTVTLTDEQQSIIEDAADIIAPVFTANNWMYFWTMPQVPSRDELADTITELVESVLVGEDTVRVSSGRISVLRSDEDDGTTTIEINLELGEFVVENNVEPRPADERLDDIRKIVDPIVAEHDTIYYEVFRRIQEIAAGER